VATPLALVYALKVSFVLILSILTSNLVLANAQEFIACQAIGKTFKLALVRRK